MEMLLSVIFWRIEPMSMPDSYRSLTLHHTHLFRENLAHKLGDDVDEFGIKFLLKIPGSARDVFGELYRSSLPCAMHPYRTEYT